MNKITGSYTYPFHPGTMVIATKEKKVAVKQMLAGMTELVYENYR